MDRLEDWLGRKVNGFETAVSTGNYNKRESLKTGFGAYTF